MKKFVTLFLHLSRQSVCIFTKYSVHDTSTSKRKICYFQNKIPFQLLIVDPFKVLRFFGQYPLIGGAKREVVFSRLFGPLFYYTINF